MIRSHGVNDSIPAQIKDYDIFNYEILRNLANIETEKYLVNFDADRIDLIAKRIYPEMQLDISLPILILLNKKREFKVGEQILYIPSDRLTKL